MSSLDLFLTKRIENPTLTLNFLEDNGLLVYSDVLVDLYSGTTSCNTQWNNYMLVLELNLSKPSSLGWKQPRLVNSLWNEERRTWTSAHLLMTILQLVVFLGWFSHIKPGGECNLCKVFSDFMWHSEAASGEIYLIINKFLSNKLFYVNAHIISHLLLLKREYELTSEWERDMEWGLSHGKEFLIVIENTSTVE